MEIQLIMAEVMTEIIVTIISIMGLAIANWVRKHPPQDSLTPKIWCKIAAITMVVCLLILVSVAGIVILKVAGPKEPAVRITYPSDGAHVEIREMIRGTSQNIPKGQVIWIVVYPQAAGRYYPQNDPADVQANGDWSSLAFIGIEEDVGRKFDIVAVLANKDAQDAFNAYLAQAKDKKTWPGLEELPNGAVIYDRITVTRK